MKKIIVVVFFAVVTSSVFGQSLSDLTFGTDETFEVVTWNIEWFPKNGLTTRDSVRAIVEALDADVFALQEISDTNIFKMLVDSLEGYETFFETNWYVGLAYLYKTDSVQILDYYEIYYTSPYWNNFPRAPKVLELMFRGEKFIIINNHYKCCGDGFLSIGNTSDQENRRYEAMNLLKSYIDTNFPTDNVILTGDLNDILTDDANNNVFQHVLDDSTNYEFLDMDIANGWPFNWSYPSWPSHLDHVLITNELFDEFENTNSTIEVIRVDDHMFGGFSDYDFKISDHRPVGVRLQLNNYISQAKNIQSENAINIYPNPAQELVRIDFENPISNGMIHIYNINGQKIGTSLLKKGETHIEMNVASLSNGVYYLHFYENNRLEVVKKLLVVK